MGHIRILRHYIHTPFILTAMVEFAVTCFAAYLGYLTRYGVFPNFEEHLPFALTFALVLSFFMIAMGVYEARLREGHLGVMLRTAVAMFLLGTIGMAVLLYLLPALSQGRGVLLFSSVEAFLFITALRWATSAFISEDFMKRRVIILGTGNRAIKVASRMRRRSDQRAFILVSFVQPADTEDLVSMYGADVTPYPKNGLFDYCKRRDVDEIVVATDDRREESSNTPMPFDELMECRLSGIEVCEVQNFIEREAGKIDVDLLQRSWLVYSDGFVANWYRTTSKRLFDIVTASILLVLFSPIIILTAFAVWACDFFSGPILYRQDRVGLNGETVRLLKFRTMQENAEESGAVWADYDDPRTTKIGSFLRRSHLDELPQLFSVLKGSLSMVGPRPERPVFVTQLEQKIPYYEQRHRIKPGLTGWAQLCYPYGASDMDAKEKLQYDLYYLKNHSLLLDLIILLQTVEVVLVGEGAR